MKAIETKFIGPSNVRGSRYAAWDSDGNRVVLSADYALNADENHDRAAKALCVKMGWTQHSLMSGGTKTGQVYVFDAHQNRVRFTDEERAQGEANNRKPKAVA